MVADGSSKLRADRAVTGISSTVQWIPDLDPARRRALGEAVVALRLAHTDHYIGQTKLTLADRLEETREEIH